jgi:hypothetical protein
MDEFIKKIQEKIEENFIFRALVIKPKNKLICYHEKLSFHSGDFNIYCRNCQRMWAMMGEYAHYGKDKDGNPIGASPENAQGIYIPEFRVKEKK